MAAKKNTKKDNELVDPDVDPTADYDAVIPDDDPVNDPVVDEDGTTVPVVDADDDVPDNVAEDPDELVPAPDPAPRTPARRLVVEVARRIAEADRGVPVSATSSLVGTFRPAAEAAIEVVQNWEGET